MHVTVVMLLEPKLIQATVTNHVMVILLKLVEDM